MKLFVALVGFRFYKLTLVYNNKACVPYATLVLSMYNSDPAIWWVILNESLNNNLSCRYSECVIFHYKVFRVHIPLMHARWRPFFSLSVLQSGSTHANILVELWLNLGRPNGIVEKGKAINIYVNGYWSI